MTGVHWILLPPLCPKRPGIRLTCFCINSTVIFHLSAFVFCYFLLLFLVFWAVPASPVRVCQSAASRRRLLSEHAQLWVEDADAVRRRHQSARQLLFPCDGARQVTPIKAQQTTSWRESLHTKRHICYASARSAHCESFTVIYNHLFSSYLFVCCRLWDRQAAPALHSFSHSAVPPGDVSLRLRLTIRMCFYVTTAAADLLHLWFIVCRTKATRMWQTDRSPHK